MEWMCIITFKNLPVEFKAHRAKIAPSQSKRVHSSGVS